MYFEVLFNFFLQINKINPIITQTYAQCKQLTPRYCSLWFIWPEIWLQTKRCPSCQLAYLRGVSRRLSSSSGSLSHSQCEVRFLFLHSQLCPFLSQTSSDTSSVGRDDALWNLLPKDPISHAEDVKIWTNNKTTSIIERCTHQRPQHIYITRWFTCARLTIMFFDKDGSTV